jgi:hypothetical protein
MRIELWELNMVAYCRLQVNELGWRWNAGLWHIQRSEALLRVHILQLVTLAWEVETSGWSGRLEITVREEEERRQISGVLYDGLHRIQAAAAWARRMQRKRPRYDSHEARTSRKAHWSPSAIVQLTAGQSLTAVAANVASADRMASSSTHTPTRVSSTSLGTLPPEVLQLTDGPRTRTPGKRKRQEAVPSRKRRPGSRDEVDDGPYDPGREETGVG